MALIETYSFWLILGAVLAGVAYAYTQLGTTRRQQRIRVRTDAAERRAKAIASRFE